MTTPATALFFEDFAPGQIMPEAETVVSRAEADAFTALYGSTAPAADPGALSGLHLTALGMRLVFDSFMSRTAGLGAPGVEAVEWLEPVRPGACLRLHAEVVAARISRSRPDMGLVSFAFALLDDRGRRVMTQTNAIMVRRREGEA